MVSPRQEYWSGLSFPSPGDLPDPTIELTSPVLSGRFFTIEPPGKSRDLTICYIIVTVTTSFYSLGNKGLEFLRGQKLTKQRSQDSKHQMGKYQHWEFRQERRDLNFQWYEHEASFNTSKGLHQRRVRGLCCCSVAKLCPTLCDPLDCSMPGFPVLHYILEFDQTHVHWVSDTIQPPHPLGRGIPCSKLSNQVQSLFLGAHEDTMQRAETHMGFPSHNTGYCSRNHLGTQALRDRCFWKEGA